MKNYLHTLLIALAPSFILAQTECGTIMKTTNINARMDDPINNWSGYVPNVNSTLKTIRVNFHFLLRDNGTGNFTETTDGYGNNYNGYMYVNDLVNEVII